MLAVARKLRQLKSRQRTEVLHFLHAPVVHTPIKLVGGTDVTTRSINSQTRFPPWGFH